MLLNTDMPKDSTLTQPHTPVRINKFSKVERYKINIQKFVAFLHVNNEKS